MSNRIKIIEKNDLLEIRIALKKNTAALVAMILATLAWVFVLFVFINITLRLHFFWYKAGMILAILSWFALGMAGASFFIWLFWGRERIIVSKDYFITDKPLVFFYRRNFYPISEVAQLRSDKEVYQVNRNGNWVEESRTVLKFETPDKQVIFARGIEKEEAEFILLQLAKRSELKKEQFAVVQKF